jgi:hypothetical protein
MIILQTAGSGESGGILGSNLLANNLDQTTTFRNNSYIHRLNRTLQAELRAVSAYDCASDLQEDSDTYAQAYTTHQNCGKQLVRIIIANRGIPEEKSSLSFGLTRRWVRLCASIDLPILAQTAKLTLTQIERNLQSNYDRLLMEAPVTDIALLEQLKRASQKQLERL